MISLTKEYKSNKNQILCKQRFDAKFNKQNLSAR